MKNITIPNETYRKLQEIKKNTGSKRYSQVIKHLIFTHVDLDADKFFGRSKNHSQ